MNCYQIIYTKEWDKDSKLLSKLVYAASKEGAKELIKQSHPGYSIIKCYKLKD